MKISYKDNIKAHVHSAYQTSKSPFSAKTVAASVGLRARERSHVAPLRVWLRTSETLRALRPVLCHTESELSLATLRCDLNNVVRKTFVLYTLWTRLPCCDLF